MFKARDAGSPVSADVLTMAAGAVQGAALFHLRDLDRLAEMDGFR